MLSCYLNVGLAEARIEEFRGAAEARLPARDPRRPIESAVTVKRAVTLRLASPRDDSALARLAALDSSVTPRPPVLLAVVDGRLLAALAFGDGNVVADPFEATSDLIELLRARVRQLGDDKRPTRSPGRDAWARRRAIRVGAVRSNG